MEHIREILARGGSLPRRVALCEDTGDIKELVDDGTGKECHPLSAIAEEVRRACGEPIYSRSTSTLLGQCLQHMGHEHAWRALHNDIVCGVVDTDAVQRHFQDSPRDGGIFVRCISTAKTLLHSALVVRCLVHCATYFSPEARMSVSDAVDLDVLMIYARHARELPTHSARGLALRSFGKILTSTASLAPIARDLGRLGLRSNPFAEDILTILTASPVAHDVPWTLYIDPTDLLETMVKTPPHRRSAFLLAAPAAAVPETLLVNSIQGGVDIQSVLTYLSRSHTANDTLLKILCDTLLNANQKGDV